MRVVFFIFLILCFVPALSFASDAERGKLIYQKRCAWCHGLRGAGDGPAAAFLSPPPRDLTLGIFKWKTTPYDEVFPADKDLFKMVAGYSHENSPPGWTGMNLTSMPGWSDVLSDEEIWDVVEHVKTLSGLEKPEKPSISVNVKSSSKAAIERGRRLFEDRCSECHGEEGRGDGRKKLKDDWGSRTWPRDLTKGWTFRAGSSVEDIYTRITVGIPGTQMPSFADKESKKMLAEDERWDVADFVASLDSPYKKPGDDTVIRARKINGSLPEGVEDGAWDSVQFASFYLIPQIVSGERHFTPTLDSISVKAAYNESALALLLEWDDPTLSVPGDERAGELSEGEVYRDGVAVEFPASSEGRPYFGMGGGLPVNIWFWQSEAKGADGALEPPSVRLMNAKGFKKIETRDALEVGLTAAGSYHKGRWRAVFRRPLKTLTPEKDIQFAGVDSVPIALAAWDGSNGEKGSRHVMTGWLTLSFEPEKKGYSPYYWAAGAALLVFILELVWLRTSRRRQAP